jgi:protein phosphatase
MAELRWGAATDTGRVRTANEDSLVAVATVFAVADGMGGHAAGEVASSVALEALQASLAQPVTLAGVVEAVRRANEAVFRRSLAEPTARGMGTTLTLIAPAKDDDERDHLVVANVGDSRGYLFADGELRQLTRDHSYVEEMLAAGQITSEEARNHPHRHVVTRALGVEPSVAVDAWLVTPEPGDRYLLCSDGLVNDVDDPAIARLLASSPDPQAAADALVKAANEAGGRDNISVVVVDVVSATGRGDDTDVLTAADTTDATAPTSVGGWLTDDLTGGFEETPNPTATTAPAAATTPPPAKPKRRLLTPATIIFVTLVAAVFVVALVVIAAAGRSGYYVGFDDDTVAVYQGRPGGVLWFQPTLEDTSDLQRDDLNADYQARIGRNPTFSSHDAAVRYIQSLRTNEDALATTTTTTSPTTTTISTATSTSTSTPTSAGP